MKDKRYLTFALGKGRLANQTLELFEKIGITCEEIYDKTFAKERKKLDESASSAVHKEIKKDTKVATGCGKCKCKAKKFAKKIIGFYRTHTRIDLLSTYKITTF